MVTGLQSGSPVVSTDSVLVDTSATYTGRISMAEDLAAEIQAEAESHLFTFTTTSENVTLAATDRESQYAVQNLNDGDYPLGFTFSVTTSDVDGKADVTVRLGHFDGAAKASSTDSGGTTDVSFTLPLVVVGHR